MAKTVVGDKQDEWAVEVLKRDTIVNRLRESDVSEKAKEADVVLFASRMKAASVLVPLVLTKSGEVQVLLTVRAQHLREGGHVAFPGGKQDDQDKDATAAALREAWEEIGLYQTDVEVISQLPPLVSRYGYFVTPITALIPEGFEPNVNPNEVEDVFRVPLSYFLSSEGHSSNIFSRMGTDIIRIHYFDHFKGDKRYVNYGLTAHYCILTAGVVYQRSPEFEMGAGKRVWNFDPKNIVPFSILENFEKKADKLSDESKL